MIFPSWGCTVVTMTREKRRGEKTNILKNVNVTKHLNVAGFSHFIFKWNKYSVAEKNKANGMLRITGKGI